MGAFKKATKTQARARIFLMGPSGSGKTWTALELAAGLGAKIAVMDTEHGSASKYADRFAFDSMEPNSFEPEVYIAAIRAAEKDGYDVIVLDSLTHAWAGKGGLLEQADRAGGQFSAWKGLTPKHTALIEAIHAAKLHVIATARVKTEYVVEENERGKKAPRKVGLAAVQRDGLEYEFDVVANLAIDNSLTIEKTRCSALHGKFFRHQNTEIAAALKSWLTDGAEAPTELETKLQASVDAAKEAKQNGGPKANGAASVSATAASQSVSANGTPDLDPARVTKIQTLFGKLGLGVAEADGRQLAGTERKEFLRDARLEKIGELIKRKINSAKALTIPEFDKCVKWADAEIAKIEAHPMAQAAREKFQVINGEGGARD